MDVDLFGSKSAFNNYFLSSRTEWRRRTNLALRVEEFDPSPGLGVRNGVILSFLIVTHGVEASNRGRRAGWCRVLCHTCVRQFARRHREDDANGAMS